MDIVQALRLIQKNDRGRQYRKRIADLIKLMKSIGTSSGAPGGLNPNAEDLSEDVASIRFQKLFRGILDRKKIEEIRYEELVFLGMAPKPKTIEERKNDPIQKSKGTEKSRKETQIERMKDYEIAKEDLKDNIKENEGPDIQDAMLKERRDWITEQIQKKGGAIPTSLEDFYNRANVEAPLTPEEEELKKLMEEEEAKNKKKGKKGGDKKAAGKKGKKGKKDEDEGEPIKMVGPPEEVQKFDEFYEKYNDTWANKDESDNFNQNYDTDMVKKEILPDVEKEFKSNVDKLIMMELENIKINQSGGKEKKKKKGGKKKKSKKGKKKKAKDPPWLTWPKKIPGLKAIKKYTDIRDLLLELVQNGIAKKLPPQSLNDFRGDFNYLHSMMDDLTQSPRDPSMALIRQIVTETCIFPLGSKLVKDRAQFIRSCLFYGPAGTGKTMVVRAIAHETASMVFDLSP